MNNTSLLKEYVKALVQNVDKHTSPKEIDLVFSGGGFNGFFAMGVAIYVIELKKQGFVKIGRLSGCSIGSLVALLCIMDNDEDIDEWFTDIAACFRTNHNLVEYHDMVRKGVMRLFPTDDMSHVNGRLFINFHDLKKKKKKVVSKYRDREHLIECILRSGHIPHIVDGNMKYKNRYSDGISPYIFDALPGVEILFVEIVTFNKLCHFIPHKTEINPQSRLLVGVADANEFFTRGSSDMCSYMKDWSTSRNVMFRCRDVLFMLIHNVIELLVGLHAYVPTEVSESIIYNGVANILKELSCEAMRRIL